MELNNITNTGTWGQQVTRLNDNFNKVALGIDTLQEMYESLSQSAIEVVDTLPTTGKANKIYRLVGTTSYSDYMYNTDDLNTPILMATYNNAIENEPTPGSNNLVKSGGVASAIVFDISAYHATGSTLATYADLTSALGTNGANVPSEVRKGGMSIKFVQTSDNKYVQYRLMSDTFNTTPANWQGVDDEPIPLSENLIKSNGVLKAIDNKQIPFAHVNVIKGYDIDVWNQDTLGEYRINNTRDVTELVYLFKDTTVINVGGNFSPMRYIYYFNDGSMIQNTSNLIPTNAYAVRLLFESGTYSDYNGLYIEQDGGYQKVSDCEFDYHIPIPQVKTGKYYDLASSQITIIDNAASKYLEPIDVSEFMGKYVEINISNYSATTSGRTMAVVNDNYSTNSSLREANPTSVSGNTATYRLFIDNNLLLVSWSLAFDIKSIIVKEAMNIGDAINNIHKILEGASEKNNKLYSKEISPKWYDGYIDNNGNFIEGESSLQRITDFISVVPGMRIQLRYASTTGRLPVTMYSGNSMDSIILSKCIEGDGGTHLEILTIPEGVNYIRTSHDSRGGADILFNPYILGDMEKVEASIPLASSINKQWLRLHRTAPKKPVIAFEMDMTNYAATNAIAYIDKLESYGVQGSTFFTFPTLNWTSTYDFQKVLREIHARNHEIALHSLPDDGTGATTVVPQATESQFRAFMKTYFDWYSKYGFYPTGWVTTQGKLYDGLLPLVKEYMCYAHTLPNGNWKTEQATDYIIPRNGDRYTFKRYGYEMGPSGTSEQETELINKIKAGIDAAVANNGMLILYCHSYNESRADYTLRDSTLTAVLEYIKPLIDSYRIVTGNVQDLVEYYFD